MEEGKEGTKTLRGLVVGVLIGVAAMLPGISGAVMAVAFGIYERLVRDIAELRVYLRKDFRFLMILVIGVAIGTVLSAKILNVVLDEYPVPSQFLFAGLILGQMPAVYRMCGRAPGERLRTADWAALILGFAIMGSMIVADIMGGREDISVAHDAAGFILMFVIGLIVAVSALVPGISHSTILIVFGAMTVFTEAIGDLELFLLLPLALGVVVGALGFSKVVHYALENHHRTTSFLILGLTVGSLITLTFTTAADVSSVVDAVAGIAAFVVGTVVSLWFVRMGGAYSDEPDAQD